MIVDVVVLNHFSPASAYMSGFGVRWGNVRRKVKHKTTVLLHHSLSNRKIIEVIPNDCSSQF